MVSLIFLRNTHKLCPRVLNNHYFLNFCRYSEMFYNYLFSNIERTRKSIFGPSSRFIFTFSCKQSFFSNVLAKLQRERITRFTLNSCTEKPKFTIFAKLYVSI